MMSELSSNSVLSIVLIAVGLSSAAISVYPWHNGMRPVFFAGLGMVAFGASEFCEQFLSPASGLVALFIGVYLIGIASALVIAERSPVNRRGKAASADHSTPPAVDKNQTSE